MTALNCGMRSITSILLIYAIAGSGGCMPLNGWHEESYFDQRAYSAEDASSAVRDENRILTFLPSIGFKSAGPPVCGAPEIEAVFIRSDNDHFHITVTVRSLVRIDQPGFVTTVRVDSYNIGEEGAMAAGKSVLSEIDEYFRKGR